MDKISYEVLDSLNVGILIVDESLRILYRNRFMKRFETQERPELVPRNLLEIFPRLNCPYYEISMIDALEKGRTLFFSAAMHGDLFPCREKYNIRVNRYAEAGTKRLLLEFTEVTDSFERIRQLKEIINQLRLLNQELKQKEKAIQNLAYYDQLTGVANRALFYVLAEKFLRAAERNQEMLGLMFIDVDNFKQINDTYGHEAGDRVLVQVAEVLTASTRRNDVVARYGGDEFLILLPKIAEAGNYKVVMSKILQAKHDAVVCNGFSVPISISVGVSFFPKDGNSIDQLIVKADHAMYAAKKRQGCDCFCPSWDD